MNHFILDTNIVLRNPELLAKGNENIRFVILEDVILELQKQNYPTNSLSRIIDLIYSSQEIGVFLLPIPTDDQTNFSIIDLNLTNHLSIEDLSIAKTTYYYNNILFPNESANIFFVTEDKDLARYIKSLGINTINYRGLRKILPNEITTNKKIEKKAITVVFQQRKELFLGLLSGIFISVLANYLFTNFHKIISTINIWGTIVIIPLLGVFLFWIRSKIRLSYGIAEFLFGLITGLRVFIPNFDYSKLDTSGYIQLAGSLYIMVRGLDNIGKGITGTRFEHYWKIFGKK